jgi:hypothetical protein
LPRRDNHAVAAVPDSHPDCRWPHRDCRATAGCLFWLPLCVQQVTHLNWFGGYYEDPKNFLIVMAVDPVTYMDVYGNEVDISSEARQTFIRERTGALVGEAMAKEWGWRVGDHVPISSNIFTQKNGSRS